MFSFCLRFYVCFCFVLFFFFFFFWFVCLFFVYMFCFVFVVFVVFFSFWFPCLCLYVCFLFFVLMTQFYVSRLRLATHRFILNPKKRHLHLVRAGKKKQRKKGGVYFVFRMNIVYKHTWMILRFFCVQIYVLKKNIDLPTLPI